jgi:AcrR family transcriptional regulator
MTTDAHIDVAAESIASSSVRPTSPVAQRLLDATIAVIDEAGEAAVRVERIVAAVGVQIPVLYRHFSNREGLVQAAQAQRLRRDLEAEVLAFRAAVDLVADAASFRALVDALLAHLRAPERRVVRWKRVNVIGSAYGRPALAAELARLQQEAVTAIASCFRRPQELGWLRPDLDLEAFAAWFGGQTLARIMVELDESHLDMAAYDEMAADAIRHVLFG